MIVILKPGAAVEDLSAIVGRIESMGLSTRTFTGEKRTVVTVIGGDEPDLANIVVMDGVERVVPVQKPYKLGCREAHPENTEVIVDSTIIGDGSFTVIAGPCTIESRRQVLDTARKVGAAGAQILRGGAFKTRTSPYSFQGLGEEGLKYLREAGDETGLPVVTEVTDTRNVQLVEKYADILQVGSRSMTSESLLKEVGKTDKPVLLKRSMSATLREFLMAAEYILSQGNMQVILCERGIKTFEPALRNTLDLAAVPYLKKETHLPVIVDPSHACGRWDLVTPLALGALAVGADGVMVEVHPKPLEALCDGPQALTPGRFASMMEDLRKLAGAMGKSISSSGKLVNI